MSKEAKVHRDAEVLSNGSDRENTPSSPPQDGVADKKDSRFVHPEAARLFAACPWTRRIPVFGQAAEGYGVKVVVALGGCYLMCKGIADYILSGQTYAMMIDRYGIEVPRYQRLSPISTMGWSIKAFTAMLCDGFAFLGYTKRWYMFASCVGGAVFALIYGLLPAKEASANTACAFIFLSSWGKANVDILTQGHYSRLIRGNPHPGPAMVSWIWFWIMTGSLISTVLNGPLADLGKPQISIFISAALQFLTAFFFLFNWYGEKKNRVQRSEDALYLLEETRKERERLGLETADADANAPNKAKRVSEHSHSDREADQAVQDALNDDVDMRGELVQNADGEFEEEEVQGEEVYYGEPPVPCLFGVFEMNKEVIRNNWRIFMYSVMMTCAVIAMLCANIMLDTLGLLIVCVIVSTILCSSSFWALPLVIAKVNVFSYLLQSVNIRVSAPVNAFYLNSYNCPGNLPNFTYTFYNTVAGVISAFVGMFTVAIFNYLFSRHTYRLTLCCTTLFTVVGGIFDIIIVKRWNEYVGIPDHGMYLFGDAVVGELVQMLAWMPKTILLARLCPRGSESVVYALMAGFANLGQTTSASLGAIIMEYGWPVFPRGNRCFYDNLPWLLFVCNICTPLLVIPLTFLLIPKARIDEDIDVDGKAVKKQVTKKVVAVAAEDVDSQEPLVSADKKQATK